MLVEHWLFLLTNLTWSVAWRLFRLRDTDLLAIRSGELGYRSAFPRVRSSSRRLCDRGWVEPNRLSSFPRIYVDVTALELVVKPAKRDPVG